MSRVLADLKAFGLQYIRSPVGAFFALIFPLILILVFGAVFSQTESVEVSLPVQDLDGTNESADFMDILNSTGTLKISMIPVSIDIEEYIKDNSLPLALQIPEGFNASINNKVGNITVPIPINVTLYGDPSRTTYNVALGSVNAAATIKNYQIFPGSYPVVGMETESIVAGGFKYIDFFLPGMIAFTVMTNALFAQSSSSAEYRTRGYFKLLGTTPLAKWEWLLAKFLWYLIILLASVALMFVVSILVFGVRVTITPTAIILVFSGILLFVSMGMLIGMVSKDPESAAAIANAIGFPMMFLSGTFFPLEMMPDFLQGVARVLPLTYMSEGMRSTMIYGNEVGALINLAVVLVLGIVFYIIASKLMRWKEK
ncbi:MAG: ABC transporter permease [Methanobacteriota archaeon]|nr:MAG: ABC transporter permease [Euryarchaeota archaeon]